MAIFWGAADEENSFLSELEENHTRQQNTNMIMKLDQEPELHSEHHPLLLKAVKMRNKIFRIKFSVSLKLFENRL